MIIRNCSPCVQEGHQDPQAAWAVIRPVGWTADVKRDPRMDRPDSADDESHEGGEEYQPAVQWKE
jgi:hypothetical protein